MIRSTLDSVSSSHGTGDASNCRYCSTFFKAGLGGAAEHAWDTILFSSRNFIITPTLGSLLPGWLLVTSKSHYLCMGAIPMALVDELKEVVELAAGWIGSTFGPATIFEHGPSKPGLTIGCGIDHAHLHVVALGFSLVDRALRAPELAGLPWEASRPDFSSLASLHNAGQSYLYVQEPRGEQVHCSPNTLPRQFLRQIIAKELGMFEQFDYRLHPHAENVRTTVSNLQAAIAVSAHLSVASPTETDNAAGWQ